MDRFGRSNRRRSLAVPDFKEKSKDKSDLSKESEMSEELKEKIFLKDLHFGFLPDHSQSLFTGCLLKVAKDNKFAAKCLNLALASRNEDLVRFLLDQVHVDKSSFSAINWTLLEPLLLKAVEHDDIEAVQCILAWRQTKGHTEKCSELGLTELDRRLLILDKSAQSVITTAAIRNNYRIVRLLYFDEYRISELNEVYYDSMQMRIEYIRQFVAKSSPAYMAFDFEGDPVNHAFRLGQMATANVESEPEFGAEYAEAHDKCAKFAVAILQSCRDFHEVDLVLSGSKCAILANYDQHNEHTQYNKQESNYYSSEYGQYRTLFTALKRDQKEFVAHPYCQVLLHNKWKGDSNHQSAKSNFFAKFLQIFALITFSPILSLLYILSPYRDHSNIEVTNNALKPVLWLLCIMDRPVTRFTLDMASYTFFLLFLLLSVIRAELDHLKRGQTWYLNATMLWVFCHLCRDLHLLLLVIRRKRSVSWFRLTFNLISDTLFVLAIALKMYGYKVAIRNVAGALVGSRNAVLDENHPINWGANLYGVAACLAFLKVILLFEIHPRFGPILFCIKKVFWDISSVMGSFLIAVLAFGVGLVSVFGIFDEHVAHFHNFDITFKTLFWIIFDPGKEEYADVVPVPATEPYKCCCNDDENIASSTMKSLNDQLGRVGPNLSSILGTNNFDLATARPADEGDRLSHGIGLYLWGAYQVLVVLILMNLLVSLMTTTFSRIQSNADREWKFSRASIWVQYFDNNTAAVPVPFNIVPSVHSICNLCEMGERRLYSQLLERVFLAEERQTEQVGKADIVELEKEIEIEIADLRRDIRALRRDLGLNSRRGSTKHLKGKEEKEMEENAEDTMDTMEEELASFKATNDPKMVEHLVQTLGLIGVDESKGLRDDKSGKRNSSAI